jgi:Family of unknown function (DUF5701)
MTKRNASSKPSAAAYALAVLWPVVRRCLLIIAVRHHSATPRGTLGSQSDPSVPPTARSPRMISQTLSNQVKTLIRLGYPAMFAMSDEAFTESMAVLDRQVPAAATACEPHAGRVPFVLVVNSRYAPAATTLPLTQREGRASVEKLYPKSPTDFTTIAQVALPDGDAYLLLDVDRGASSLNVAPDDAYTSIAEAGRSPLTIAEGIALLTHFPEFLQPNNCFSLLASRCGDKRVPALWLSEGRPKLGWCWAGNPHTWLGSASCAKRAGSANICATAPSGA